MTGVLLPTVLAAAATGTALAAPTVAYRLELALPAPTAPAKPAAPGLPRPLVHAATASAAATAWWLVGGLAGVLAAAGVLLLVPAGLRRLERPPDDSPEVAAVLPLALDLLAACLSGGAAPAAALSVVAQALPGPCGARFARVAAALAVGCGPAEAWQALGDDRGPAGSAARALARAADGGAPVAAAVHRVARDARRDARARAERAARRAGVLAVGPLGLCFLPAFLLIGVVPTVIGLAAPLLSAL